MSTNLKELEKTFLRFVEISTVSGGPKLDEETGLMSTNRLCFQQ